MKKKIIILHHCDYWGGAGVSLVYCCKILLTQYDVTVCLPHVESEVGDELRKIEGLKIISLGEQIAVVGAYNGGPKWYSRTFWKGILRIKRSKQLVKRILLENNYDLVIANTITLSWVSKLASKVDMKNLCYIRETKVKHIGYAISKRYLEKYCDGIMYISEYDKKEMGIKTEHCKVIPDIVQFETNYHNKYDIPKNEFVVAYLGGDDYIKGYPTVRELVSMPEAKTFKTVIAGKVSEDKKVKCDNAIYLGIISDVGELLSEADLLIFPSLVGHQARPIFEAGAFHVPVVVSDFPQTKENIIDGWNGYEFKAGDAEELLSKIILIKDNNNSKVLGENNYKLFMENHSFAECEGRMLHFIESIIEE